MDLPGDGLPWGTPGSPQSHRLARVKQGKLVPHPVIGTIVPSTINLSYKLHPAMAFTQQKDNIEDKSATFFALPLPELQEQTRRRWHLFRKQTSRRTFSTEPFTKGLPLPPDSCVGKTSPQAGGLPGDRHHGVSMPQRQTAGPTRNRKRSGRPLSVRASAQPIG